MSKSYGELIKELYEQKYFGKQIIGSSCDRAMQIQKKMNQYTNKKADRLSFSLKLRNNTSILKQDQPDSPKRIFKHKINKPALLQTDTLVSSKRKDRNVVEYLTLKTSARTNKKLYKNRSFSQRQNWAVSCKRDKYFPYDDCQFKIQNSQKTKRMTPMTSQGARRHSTQNRALTPSRNVFIGGFNLQQHAEVYQKQFKRLDLQMQKHRKKIQQQKQIDKKVVKTVPKKYQSLNEYQNQSNISYRKQNMLMKQTRQIMLKIQKNSQVKQVGKMKLKQQVVDLQPWTVLVPQYQYY